MEKKGKRLTDDRQGVDKNIWFWEVLWDNGREVEDDPDEPEEDQGSSPTP